MIKKWTMCFVIILAFAFSACGGSTPSSTVAKSDKQNDTAMEWSKEIKDDTDSEFVKQCKKIGHTKQSDIDTCVEGFNELKNLRPPNAEEKAKAAKDSFYKTCLEAGGRGKEVDECAESMKTP